MKHSKALTLISVLVLCLFSVLLLSACTLPTSIDSLEYTTTNNIRYLGTKSNPYLILVQKFDTASTCVLIKAGVRFIYNSAFKLLQS